MPARTATLPTGVSPMRCPSTHTSAHGTAFRLRLPSGSWTEMLRDLAALHLHVARGAEADGVVAKLEVVIARRHHDSIGARRAEQPAAFVDLQLLGRVDRQPAAGRDVGWRGVERDEDRRRGARRHLHDLPHRSVRPFDDHRVRARLHVGNRRPVRRRRSCRRSARARRPGSDFTSTVPVTTLRLNSTSCEISLPPITLTWNERPAPSRLEADAVLAGGQIEAQRRLAARRLVDEHLALWASRRSTACRCWPAARSR